MVAVVLLFPIQPAHSGFWQWTRLSGATDSNPALHMVSSNLMYVAVKGTDNGIYWCNVNPDPTTPSQGPWRKLTGKTLSGPSIDMASFTLYVVVRGMDNGIYFTTVDTLAYPPVQGPWHKLTGATLDSPSIRVTGTYMYVVVRGSDDGIYWTRITLSNLQQGPWHRLSGKTPSGPAIDGYDTLYVAVRGADNGIYITTVDALSGVQSAWIRMTHGATIDSPTIISYSSTSALVGVRGADSGIYGSWSVNPSTGEGSFQKLPGMTSSGPRVKSWNGEVWVARGMDNGIYWMLT